MDSNDFKEYSATEENYLSLQNDTSNSRQNKNDCKLTIHSLVKIVFKLQIKLTFYAISITLIIGLSEIHKSSISDT